MNESQIYVAYVDLLGVGDASLEDTETYHDQLRRFRSALCDAVDRHLEGSDKVFAFSDCAFTSSSSLERLGLYLMRLQYRLWEQNIFLKGAISVGKPDYYEFGALPSQSKELIKERKKKLHGYWFAKEFIQPALLEKNLKGIAIQVDSSIKDTEWIKKHVIVSSYFPSDTSKRPIVIRDLLIPELHLESLNNLLETYMRISHGSRRTSRYYVPLVVTWIRSHDYSKIEFDAQTGEWNNAPLPLQQLILNSKIASEITVLVGGDVIFYSLLSKVAAECEAAKVTERVFDFIANNKKLRAASEFMPDDICSLSIRRKMIDSRIRYLFKATK